MSNSYIVQVTLGHKPLTYIHYNYITHARVQTSWQHGMILSHKKTTYKLHRKGTTGPHTKPHTVPFNMYYTTPYHTHIHYLLFNSEGAKHRVQRTTHLNTHS